MRARGTNYGMMHFFKLLMLTLGIWLVHAQPLAAELTTGQPPTNRVACITEDDIVHIPADTTTQIDISLLRKMLYCAAARRLTLFELFDELIVLLKEGSQRIVIPGDSLRSLNRIFQYGGERMLYLFPVQLIDRVECGASLEMLPQLEIYLHGPAPDYVEKVNWVGETATKIEKHYGCAEIEIEKYEQCFGLSAVTKHFMGTVTKIILYEEAKIAIYIKDFFRPKRWELGRIARNRK